MSENRIEFMDFARGIAISTIVLMHLLQRMHLNTFLQQITSFGGTGVHLFIFLSGFGLALSNYKTLSDFLKRRISKVIIPYYICITLIFILNHIIPIYEDNWYAYFGHICFYKMFDDRIIGSFGYPLWFMSTIIQFYFIFPLLIKIKNGVKTKLFLTFAMLISLSWWLFIFNSGKYTLRTYNSFFPQFLWEFCFGIILADYYKNYGIKFWEQTNKVLIFVAIIGISLQSFLVLEFKDVGKIFNDIPAFFGYTAITILFFRFFNKTFTFLKVMVENIGVVSYQIYLFHSILFSLIAYIFNYII